MWNSLRPQARGAIIAVLLLFAGTTVLASCGKPAMSPGETGRSAGALAEIVLEIPTIT